MHTFAIGEPGISAQEPSGADIWNTIVQAAIGAFRSRAFHEVTSEVVAEESGLDSAVIVERFPTFDDLVVATVQVWNADRMGRAVPLAERDGAVAFLRALLQEHAADSSLTRLLIAVVNIAATPDHPMAQVLQRQWIQFHALVERALARDAALGREPAAIDPARAAGQLIAMFEGLQLQSMMRPGMDLFDAWDHAIGTLRQGWSHAMHTVWEI